MFAFYASLCSFFCSLVCSQELGWSLPNPPCGSAILSCRRWGEWVLSSPWDPSCIGAPSPAPLGFSQVDWPLEFRLIGWHPDEGHLFVLRVFNVVFFKNPTFKKSLLNLLQYRCYILCFGFWALRHVGSNPHPLHWKVKSQPLGRQGSPITLFLD